jgi:hypothetical protein
MKANSVFNTALNNLCTHKLSVHLFFWYEDYDSQRTIVTTAS